MLRFEHSLVGSVWCALVAATMLVAGCAQGGVSLGETGSMVVSNTTTGGDQPAGPYEVRVTDAFGASISGPMAVDGSVTFDDLSFSGRFGVQLTEGVTPNCDVAGVLASGPDWSFDADHMRYTDVEILQRSGAAHFDIGCSPTRIAVTATTTSGTPEPPGTYSVTVDGGDAIPTEINATDPTVQEATVRFLSTGTHEVLLQPTPECSVVTENPLSVDVAQGLTAPADFDVECPVAGGTWARLPSGSPYGIHDLTFVDIDVGYASGALSVGRTADGGVTWTWQEITTVTLQAIDCVDAATCWAVGNDGIIFHTANGADWAPQDGGTTGHLFGTSFVDAQLGYAVGVSVPGGNPVVLRTTDGSTWNAVGSFPAVAGCCNDVFFVDPNVGWVAGHNGLYATVDGGATWTPQVDPTGSCCWELHFEDATHGWGVGSSGSIIRTTDGSSWADASPAGASNQFMSLDFADASNGVAVGVGGMIFRTTDGGVTWNEDADPSDVGFVTLNGVAMRDTGRAVAFGEVSDDGSGTIEATMLHRTPGTMP